MLHVDMALAKSWSNEEVAKRWTTLYKAPLLGSRWLSGELKSKAEINKLALLYLLRFRSLVVRMTQSRSTQVSLQDTAYYHCISRCVRRAFLCGEDNYSGQSFEHRRVWIVERMRLLSQVFSIDVCAYAIMSNHYHLVLHVDTALAKSWSNEEVAKRWTTLYKAPLLVSRWLSGELKSKAEINKTLELIEEWRERLTDISWLMRNLNEFIAREANKEEGCKGRFREGCFKSQALLDEKALLSCMAYVDLNPVRADMAQTLEESEFTSIYERIHSFACQQDTGKGEIASLPAKGLTGFLDNERETQSSVLSKRGGIEFSLLDYLALVEELGQVVRPNKRGYIPPSHNSLLERLNMNAEEWLTLSESFGGKFRCAVGSAKELESYALHTNRAWVSGKCSMSLYDL
ncbi:transposase [Vibrio tapetis]|uniref:transposase n=1 Tax=Vibrio tapetis TaxID=52443 RepID=UPI001E325E6F|nr:transposase [Vibrio tapetis]